MLWKRVLVGGAFVGVFSLGALFSPIGQPKATTEEQNIVKNRSMVLTAAENDSSQQAINNDICPMSGAPMGNGFRMGQYFSGNMSEVVADTLGITLEELQAARYEGKSVAELANEKGINKDELVNKLIQSRKADLEQAVTDGTLTQEQMDAMLANMKVQIKNSVERKNVGPMNGNRGGHMMGMGQSGRSNGSLQNQPIN